MSGGSSTAISLASSWITDLNSQPNAGNFGYTGYLLYPDPLNVPNNNNEPPQELLIAVPVPEAPTVLAGLRLLLPPGASAFRILRRKH